MESKEITQRTLWAKQKQTRRCRKQSYGYPGERAGWGDKLGVWENRRKRLCIKEISNTCLLSGTGNIIQYPAMTYTGKSPEENAVPIKPNHRGRTPDTNTIRYISCTPAMTRTTTKRKNEGKERENERRKEPEEEGRREGKKERKSGMEVGSMEGGMEVGSMEGGKGRKRGRRKEFKGELGYDPAGDPTAHPRPQGIYPEEMKTPKGNRWMHPSVHRSAL